MLQSLLGSENAERPLIFLNVRKEGYATEIARFFDVDLHTIQKQLEKFEGGGILVSRTVGRTRVYQFNPSYAFLPELRRILSKAFYFYPPDLKENLQFNRRRPRKGDKRI
jgi:predicted transcriptional regulator